jgi:hypothetical protein
VRESTQIGGQQQNKFNLYNLPDIFGQNNVFQNCLMFLERWDFSRLSKMFGYKRKLSATL